MNYQSAEERTAARDIAQAMVNGELASNGRLAGGTIIALLDDLDELLNANARLAPKAKAHDAALAYLSDLEWAATEMEHSASACEDAGLPLQVIDGNRAIATTLRSIVMVLRGGT